MTGARAVPALLALLLLPACTGGADPAQRPGARGTPAGSAPAASAAAPSAVASPADPTDLPVAVMRSGGGLELHRVDRARRTAALDRVLEPPGEGDDVLDVAMSSGQDPVVCAIWHTGPTTVQEDRTSELICYEPGASEGRPVAGIYRPILLALSGDGSRLAWAELDVDGGNQAIGAGTLREGDLIALRRFVADPARPEDAFDGTSVQDLAWVDADQVLISTAVESDDGPRLLRFDVTAPGARGWLREGRPIRTSDPGYVAFESVVSVLDGTSALAVQRGSFVVGTPPPSRAVRIDLGTGKVLQVVATAAAGREVLGVSGDADEVVYVTAAGREGPLQAYLRTAGEAQGTPITGLPADTRAVLAQGQVSGRSG